MAGIELCLALCNPNKVIAHTLRVSVRTVEVNRVRMLERLRTRTVADAIRLGILAALL